MCNFARFLKQNILIMDELKKLVNALACVKEIENYVEDFKGDKDFLENIKEPLEDVKVYLSDAIAINAKRV